jgi:hypothetical protein
VSSDWFVHLRKIFRKDSEGNMDTRLHIQKLRLHLLEMSRVSQRTIDYSTKADRLGRSELYIYFRDARLDLDDCHREIARLSQQLLAMEQISRSDRIFVRSTERIANCLREACSKARGIFRSTMLLRRDSRSLERAKFIQMGDAVNGLVRLCVVALFKKEVKHAKTVLDSYRREWRSLAEPPSGSETGMELAIAQDIAEDLDEIANQVHEMARAIVFWLEFTDSALKSDARKVRSGFRESLSGAYLGG